MSKYRGCKVQHRECSQWYCNSVVWSQMGATLAVSTAQHVDLSDRHVVHLNLIYRGVFTTLPFLKRCLPLYRNGMRARHCRGRGKWKTNHLPKTDPLSSFHSGPGLEQSLSIVKTVVGTEASLPCAVGKLKTRHTRANPTRRHQQKLRQTPFSCGRPQTWQRKQISYVELHYFFPVGHFSRIRVGLLQENALSAGSLLHGSTCQLPHYF